MPVDRLPKIPRKQEGRCADCGTCCATAFCDACAPPPTGLRYSHGPSVHIEGRADIAYRHNGQAVAFSKKTY